MNEKNFQEYFEPELKTFERHVDKLMDLLQKLNSTDDKTQKEGVDEADRFLGVDRHFENINEDNFIAEYTFDKTIINKKDDDGDDEGPSNKEKTKLAFMHQVEIDAKQRAENRKQREEIALRLRACGNDAFRNGEYEKAISIFSKAIDHIKYSPITYCNRALSYIKLKLFKRAIMDCDYVIHNLNDKYLRAWLYRSTAYYHLNDEYNFETSIQTAKKTNPKEIETIDKFIENMKASN